VGFGAVTNRDCVAALVWMDLENPLVKRLLDGGPLLLHRRGANQPGALQLIWVGGRGGDGDGSKAGWRGARGCRALGGGGVRASTSHAQRVREGKAWQLDGFEGRGARRRGEEGDGGDVKQSHGEQEDLEPGRLHGSPPRDCSNPLSKN